MLLTDRNAKAIFQARLQPGETLLHHAYGVKQPGAAVIVLMYIFCVVVPAALLLRFITKHFLIGLTDRQLIVLRFVDLERPAEAWAYDRATLRAKGKEGLFWSRLEVTGGAPPFAAKFHRAALPHNREQMRGILRQLTGAVFPGASS